MESYTTLGYKDLFKRIFILLNGLFLLFVINYSIFYYMFNKTVPRYFFIVIIVVSLVFRLDIKLANNLKYEFSDKWIKIILPSGREYMIEKSNIVKLEKVWYIPWRYGSWIKYRFLSNELMFTTWRTNILRIVTRDWKNILISPKKIADYILVAY